VKRVGVYVDVQNVYYTVKQKYHAHFNYLHLLETVRRGRKLIKANAYATHRNDADQRRFQGLLSHFGYKVKLIDYIVRADGSSKGNWDTGICLDLLEDYKTLDHVVLVTGDGDFAEVIHHLKKTRPITVDLYGVTGLTAKNLIEVVDSYYPIDQDLLLAIPDKW
jgi:uncharacterized LabA/DUF88 family protein